MNATRLSDLQDNKTLPHRVALKSKVVVSATVILPLPFVVIILWHVGMHGDFITPIVLIY